MFDRFFDDLQPIDTASESKLPNVAMSSEINLNDPLHEDHTEDQEQQLISDSFTRSEDILAKQSQLTPDSSYIKQRAANIQKSLEENPYQVDLWEERSILFEQSKSWPQAISDLLRVIMMLSKSSDEKALLEHKKRLSLLYVKADVKQPHHGLENLFNKNKVRRIKSGLARPQKASVQKSPVKTQSQ